MYDLHDIMDINGRVNLIIPPLAIFLVKAPETQSMSVVLGALRLEELLPVLCSHYTQPLPFPLDPPTEFTILPNPLA